MEQLLIIRYQCMVIDNFYYGRRHATKVKRRRKKEKDIIIIKKHPQTMAGIPSKDEVLAQLDSISYHQRARYAGSLGRDLSSSSSLSSLISDMRKVN